MHETFYQLSAEPFRLSPDSRFCFQHRTYRKAMTYMRHALHRAEGFIMITGRPGTGKTTLIQDLLQTLRPDQAMIANLVTTQMTANDLLRLVAYSYNLDPEGVDKVDVLVRIDKFLKQQYQQGRRPLLIVDEAQDMAEDALEELRLLTNIHAGGQQILQIFLLGQEQLRDLVNAPSMEQLHQRMIAATHLEPLDKNDTEAYIKHRLRRVSWAGDPLLSKEAYALIQQYSQGIPRQINQICNRLFLHGSIEEKHRLGISDVIIVIEELRQEFLLPMETANIAAAVPLPTDQQQETYEEEPSRQTAPAAPKKPPPAAKTGPVAEPALQESTPVAPAGLPAMPEYELTNAVPPAASSQQERMQQAANADMAATPNEPARETPVTDPWPDQAVPGKEQAPSRKSWGLLLLAGLIVGLALAFKYSPYPDFVRQAVQKLIAGDYSDIQMQSGSTTENSLPDITDPAENMGKGTVIRESSPVNHEPNIDVADVETDTVVLKTETVEPMTETVNIETDPSDTATVTQQTDLDLPLVRPLQLEEKTLEEELQQSGLLVERMDDDTLKVNLSSDGMFDFDSALIKDEARPALEKLTVVLQKHDDLTIQVVGHTDSSGAAEYNLHLSHLRSKAVADDLIKQGFSESSIASEGRGDQDTRLEHSPVYNPDLKRRVEIYIRQAQEM